MSGNSRLERVVLVHGAAHGAWCWEETVPLLRAKGFEVTTLDLPGLGDDPTPPKDVTLQSYIDRVVEVVEAGQTPVLLVGHSMGGMPISGAAEAIPGKIGKLFYLAAIMPADGEPMFTPSVGGAESATRALRPSAVEGAHEFIPELGPEIFYNCCTPEIAASASARLRPQAGGPLGTPISLSPARFGTVAKTYIVCAKDQALPPEQQHGFCARAPDVKKRIMDTDHSPFYSDPVGLAQLIEEEARI